MPRPSMLKVSRSHWLVLLAPVHEPSRHAFWWRIMAHNKMYLSPLFCWAQGEERNETNSVRTFPSPQGQGAQSEHADGGAGGLGGGCEGAGGAIVLEDFAIVVGGDRDVREEQEKIVLLPRLQHVCR